MSVLLVVLALVVFAVLVVLFVRVERRRADYRWLRECALARTNAALEQVEARLDRIEQKEW